MLTTFFSLAVFLVTEPIVFLLAIYVSIVYGTLYALFSGFPIVFQQHRHFTPGEGGLAFLGVGLGITCGTASQTIQNRIYWRSMDKSETGRAPPEACVEHILLWHVVRVLFLFSIQPTAHGYFWRSLNSCWIVVVRLVNSLILQTETNPEPLSIHRTTRPAIHWIVPILGGIPFGMGVAQILQSLTTYLMDTYNIYFASAIAATVVLRSTCGAVFPLFSPAMFKALGDERAMSVFACLSTICMPIPLLFWVRI